MRTNSNVRSIVFIALFAALFIVMSSIEVKIGLPVPITLQTFAVILAGVFLGPRNGFISIIVVLALTATGLPLLHGRGGLSYLVGATGGFLWVFPLCALLIGFTTSKVLKSPYFKQNRIAAIIVLFILFELFSSFLAYVVGIPWLMHVTGFSFAKAMLNGCYPFLIGDAIKSFIAVLLTLTLRPYILRIQSSISSKPQQHTSTTTL
ncbi:MAG: biotin transporter BioY [Candidatus Pristimantibacillus sp.]